MKARVKEENRRFPPQPLHVDFLAFQMHLISLSQSSTRHASLIAQSDQTLLSLLRCPYLEKKQLSACKRRIEELERIRTAKASTNTVRSDESVCAAAWYR